MTASVCPARVKTPPSRARMGKTCPGGCDVACVFFGINGDRDRMGAVMGGNACRHAFASFYGNGESGLKMSVVSRGHELQAQRIGALLGERQADEPARMDCHKINNVRRRHLRGNDEIAFILAGFLNRPE